MLKSQEQIFLKVEEIQREQNNVARAVLDLAHHMARITFIDDAGVDDEEDERGPLQASSSGAAADATTSRPRPERNSRRSISSFSQWA